MIKSKSDFALIATILFLLLALGASLVLVRQRQIIQKRAVGDTATLSLAPNSGSYNLNSSISTKIWINTGTKKINIAKVVLNFDKTRLQVDSEIQPTANNGLGNVITKTTPAEANTSGQITITLGVPGGQAANAPSGTIDFATIPFKAISAGTAQVTFVNDQIRIVQQVDDQLMQVTSSGATYQVGGGATGTPTPTSTPGPTTTPTTTPVPTATPTTPPPGAPSISGISNYCGKPSETILTVYGTNFGTAQGESKVYFRYKASPIADDSTYQEALSDVASWTNTAVFARVPAVNFGSNNAVVAKIKLVKAGFADNPALFPGGSSAFFAIAQSLPKYVADLNCDNAVNEADFSILLNFYNK